MKSQIFAAIAIFVAGVYTVERNRVEPIPLEAKTPVLLSTEQIIKQSSLNQLKEDIEEKEDSTSYLIRETIQDKIVDSVTQPIQDTIIK